MIKSEQDCKIPTCRWRHSDDWPASCSQLAAKSELSQHTVSSNHVITQQQKQHNTNRISNNDTDRQNDFNIQQQQHYQQQQQQQTCLMALNPG